MFYISKAFSKRYNVQDPRILAFLVLQVCMTLCCYAGRIVRDIGADDSSFFKEAVPVWIDSRNVKNKDAEYTLTSSGRHTSRQAEPNLTVSFRVVFHVDSGDDVDFRLAASSTYRAYLNGEFIGYGPCVAAHGYYRVDEYKLRELLRSGENVLAVEVAGYNVYTYYTLNQPSFLQAEVVKGDRVLAATKTRAGEGGFEATLLDHRIQDVPLYSFQRPHTESYHLSVGHKDWMSDSGDARFKPLKLERTSTKKLLSRRVKYPDYTVRQSVENLGDSLFRFEVNSTGFIGLRATVRTPVQLVLSWDEILTKGDVNPHRLNTQNFITYNLDPGEYELESFEPYTLQYLKVVVKEGSCDLERPFIRQYVNSDVKGAFWCSDEKISKVYGAAVETYKQNALDIFMDCPQRERAGWLCDSYFTGRVAFDLSGNTLIEKNFLENFLLPEKFEFIPEGMLPMCYPSDHANGNYIPNWAMWFVLELEEYFKRSQDYGMIVEAKPRVLALVDFFEPYENEFGLLEDLEKWIFVEWSKANHFVDGVNYPTNMLYSKFLEVTGRIYSLPHLLEKAERLRNTIREQAYDGLFFVDNAIRIEGKLVPQPKNRTETCQYYAFFFEIADSDRYGDLFHVLVNDFGPHRKDTKKYQEIFPSNAFIGNYLRLEILSRYGLASQLLRECVDEYLKMAELTGTLWENTHTRASLNHGFASHIAHVFYRDLLGVKEVDVINKKIFITFNPHELEFCGGILPLGEEKIALKWGVSNGKLEYDYSVPKGFEVLLTNRTDYELKKTSLLE